MKYTNIKAFEKHLEEADHQHLADVYAIISKDEFLRKSATDKLIQVLLKPQNNAEFALKVFDAEKFSFEDLFQELSSYPFFSEKRVLLLQNGESLSKNEMSRLEDYFTKPNRTVCLILSASAFIKTTNFYKKLEKEGIILDIVEEKSWEKEKTAKEWILGKIFKEKKKIHPEALNLIQKQVGNDFATLNQEIDKLICYVGERNEIQIKDVSVLTTNVHTETIWQLSDAIFLRNPLKALSITKSILDEGTPFLVFLRQVRGQIQTGFQIATILSTGGGGDEIVKIYPYMKGRILESHIHSATSYGLVRFKKAMLKIDEIEAQAKNGMGQDSFLAEMLISHLVI